MRGTKETFWEAVEFFGGAAFFAGIFGWIIYGWYKGWIW